MPPRSRRSGPASGPLASPKKECSESPAAAIAASGPSPTPHDGCGGNAAMPLIKTTPKSVRMSYRIGRGEQGVLTFEPYKSAILPLWRFRTVPIAQKSAADLWRRFEQYCDEGDFVGADMTKKFINMGQTRAKRYANHAGGRKYKKGTREELPRSENHPDKQEKEEASLVFRRVLEQCKTHEAYLRLKDDFLQEQKEWKKMH